MNISLIAAMAKNRVIGHHNQMPWHLPADLKHFQQLTLHKPTLMGRKTFDSIGRPLPNRRNIVITRQRQAFIPDVDIFYSLDDALEALRDEPEIMVTGGELIFQQALPIANRMYLTFIDLEVTGDTFFPTWNENEWQEISVDQHAPNSNNLYSYQFVEYHRTP